MKPLQTETQILSMRAVYLDRLLRAVSKLTCAVMPLGTFDSAYSLTVCILYVAIDQSGIQQTL